MVEPRKLANPPIVEALVDFQVTLPDGFDPESLARLGSELSEYPDAEPRRLVESFVKIQKHSAESRTRQGLHGYWFRSNDKSRLVQCRTDGFTFNRLRPYDDWETLSSEAFRAWDRYVSFVQPLRVTRVALRYINRFKLTIEAGGPGFEEFLEAPPQVPEGLRPEELNRDFSRLTLVEPGSDIRSNVSQVIDPPTGDTLTVTLDIDVYKSGEFGVAREELAGTLEALRRKKNEIFFGSLKERALALFG